MGRKAKSARAEKRKMAKRATKAQKRALYESYATSGQNKKSKRFKLGNRRAKNTVKERIRVAVPVIMLGVIVQALRSVHASPERCGNVGCRKPQCHGA